MAMELRLDSGRTNDSIAPPSWRSSFLRFRFAVDKSSTIAQSRNGNNWNILFRKLVQDSEMNHLMELLADVERYNIDETMGDIMYWRRQGMFTVKRVLQED